MADGSMSFEAWLSQNDQYRASFVDQLIQELDSQSPSTQDAMGAPSSSVEISPVTLPSYPLLSPVSMTTQTIQSPSESGNHTSESGYSSGVISWDDIPSPAGLSLNEEWCLQEAQATPSEIHAVNQAAVNDSDNDSCAQYLSPEDNTNKNLNHLPSIVAFPQGEIATDFHQVNTLNCDSGLEKETEKEAKTATSPASANGAKPEESFIEILAKAILGSAEQKLILADLYSYVATNYPYYPASTCAWRNSVRHNLSVNECFIKAGRASSGRGFFWAIHPACVEDFVRGDFNRRQARRRVQEVNKKTEKALKAAQVCSRVSQAASCNVEEAQRVPCVPTHNQLTSTPIRQAAYHPYPRPGGSWENRRAHGAYRSPMRGATTHGNYGTNVQSMTPYSMSAGHGYTNQQQSAYSYSPSWSNQYPVEASSPYNLYTPLSNLAQLGYSTASYDNTNVATNTWWNTTEQGSYW